MSGEWKAFYSTLALLLSIKCGVEKSKITTWIRMKINFALLQCMMPCLDIYVDPSSPTQGIKNTMIL